jgi:hypothetical protein
VSKSWRPSGWNNPHKIEYERLKYSSWGGEETVAFREFEFGADALWDALWKLAQESPTGTYTIDSNVQNIYEVK